MRTDFLNIKIPPSTYRRDLVAFFLIAFLLSWAIEIPLGLSARGAIPPIFPYWLHYLSAFGPSIAALVVTFARRGLSGVGELLSGLLKWRVKRNYFLFAVIAPILVFGAIVIATRLLQGAWPDLALLGQPDYLPYLGILPTLVLWTATFGVGEELGWRGFALPRLQAIRSAFSASIFLGAFWAIWHLPALFYRDTYVQMGLLVIPMLLSVAAVGSIVYTWLYNGTGGSLLMVVIFHGLFDFFSVWPEGIVAPGMVMTILMVFWAVRVYKLYGRENLAPREKVTQ